MTFSSQKTDLAKLQSAATLLEMMYGFQISQAIYVATQLGIPDLLQNGSQSSEEVAQKLDIPRQRLEPLLHLLVSVGIFTENQDNTFQLNALSQHLLAGTPHSLRGTVLSMGAILYPLWGHLLEGIQTEEIAFTKTFNSSLYTYLQQNPETANRFNEWMQETTREWLFPILETYDFSGLKTLVDVGGGTGSLIAIILNANPQMQAILFDREDVVQGAPAVLTEAGVAQRCQIIGGDFFQTIPSGGDLYLLSRVLLNWEDPQALEILKNCHQAMSPKDRLVIVDFMLSPGQTSPFLGMGSLSLLLLGGHCMRTEDEFENLLSSAGFQITNRLKTSGPVSIMEAQPANF
ncbi:methyltransferase [Geitlerinema calcuttense]|uniref:Methyltransferase n=1 Tax=Geitlerinema calcuttense NRMC-F 0142 TaxID=2922238 RepID=A0ABT7M0J0_9CYAN|nr:methyltransferase [Geitlerinema calcuttense]MDL5057347.1 methyltransferase [Geitlerinema calcuttense NRMC-F 0142]